MAVAAMLTVPTFLIGPSTAGTGGTTSTAATHRSSTVTAAARPAIATAPTGAASPASSPAATATTEAPSPAGVVSPTPTPTSSATAAGLTTEPTRARRFTITQTRRNNTRSFCGGKLTFGTVKTCPWISDLAKDTWTVTTTADSDTLYAQFDEVSGVSLTAWVSGGDGTRFCDLAAALNQCRLGPAGTYTIAVTTDSGSGTGSYTLSTESRRTPSTCEQLPQDVFSWASAGVGGTLPAGLAARCFTFDQPTGTALYIAKPHLRDPGTGALRAVIMDARHQQLCQSGHDDSDCTLNTPGPYRVFLHEDHGEQTAYALWMPRISQAVGCPTLPLAPFGDPGTAARRALLQPNQRVCHSFSTTTAGEVAVRIDSFTEQYLRWKLYDNAGRRICDRSSARYCTLPAAGSYTVLLWSAFHPNVLDYRLAVTALHRVDGCASTTGTSWDQPTLRLQQTSPVQTNCQPFQGRAGDRVVTYVENRDSTWLVDQKGARICASSSDGEAGCVLPADGSYRVISYLPAWDAEGSNTYPMQIRRLSDAVGCPTLAPGSYDVAPTVGGIRCRALEITQAGDYRLRTVGADNDAVSSRVYDRAGRLVCVPGRCTLPTAARYTLVFGPDSVVENDVEHAAALLPWAPSDCAAVSDTGWRDAPHRGAFQAAGQIDCLRLTSPAGSRIVLSEPVEGPDDRQAEIIVVDATGTDVCPTGSSCELTGPAPFFALVNGVIHEPTGRYALAFSRVDGPPACPVLPPDTTVTTGADRFVTCFSIPADQHAAMESFTWKRTAGSGVAEVSVLDSRGVERWNCGGGRAAEWAFTCSLPEGPLTVLLETDGKDATYRLTHRDASTPAA